MQRVIEGLPAGTPLWLHACCAPCLSAVAERLGAHFALTVYFENPNIQPLAEYERRRDEVRRLLTLLPARYPIQFVEAPYNEAAFLAAARGLEGQPEGGARCEACFGLRLSGTARAARQAGFAWMATTLSISPHKNAALLNTIGQSEAEAEGLHWLPADFKKRGGYQRSLQLSREYGLYRQSWCGCRFGAQGGA